jgi:predicted ATP-dependent serine protease
MAHYDCDHCGASMGIAFGICENCTPKDYLIKKRELERAEKDAATEFDDVVREIKSSYIKEKTKVLREELLEIESKAVPLA